MKAAPAGLFAALALAGLLGGPAASVPGAQLAVGEELPAGEFRGYRVRLFEEGFLEANLAYFVHRTDQGVLPMLAVVKGPDGFLASMYLTPESWRESGPALGVRVEARAGEVTLAYGDASGGVGFAVSFLTVPGPPGDYDFVFVTAPAEGLAFAEAVAFAPAELVGTAAGASISERGVDRAPAALEARAVQGLRTELLTAWGHAPADVPTPVQGRLFGYLDTAGGLARWLDPAGGAHSGLVAGGEPGAWTASFPADGFAWSCASADLCESRPHPALALGADVRLP